MQNIFNNVYVGWLLRRVQEIGGLAAVLYSIYMGLPPDAKLAINDLLQGGDWHKVSLGTTVGLVLYLIAQAQSLFATVRPQVVADGVKVPLKKLAPADRTLVEQKAITAAEKPKKRETLLERLFGQR